MQRRQLMPRDYLVIWLSEHIDLINEDNITEFKELQKVVRNLYTCANYDTCFDRIIEHEHEKVIFILSAPIEKVRVRQIHDMPQIYSIYIYRKTITSYEGWKTEFSKIQVIGTDIKSICEALQKTIWQPNQSSTSISFLTSSDDGSEQTLEDLDPIFMYTELLKEIILSTQYNTKNRRDFIEFLRAENRTDANRLKMIDIFEKNDPPRSSISWYTYDILFYDLANSSLRNFNVEKIIKSSFFLSSLHRQLEDLHKQRVNLGHGKFYVYRGQILSKDDFNKLQEGALISFNSFLSTSEEESVASGYAESNANAPENGVGVLFRMLIDPNIPSTPFARIKNISQFYDEQEVLFSMQAVFRIRKIQEYPKNNAVRQVDLDLTPDKDPQLCKLKNFIREEIDGKTDWDRLGKLLIKIGQYSEAEKWYTTQLKQISSDRNAVDDIEYYLGIAKLEQGEYQDAASFFKKSLEITRHSSSKGPALLAGIHSMIGSAYKGMGDYLKALESYEIAYDIFKLNPHCNGYLFGSLCNQIGAVYHDMGQYVEALNYYEIARDTYKIILPSNHPILASTYNNIGELYRCLGNYSKALDSHKLALEIDKKSLPHNHVDLATSLNNIGIVYEKMKDYMNAMYYHTSAREIFEKLDYKHPGLANSYHNIAEVYRQLGKYSNALEYFEKGLEICQKTLDSHHPSFAISYQCIGAVHTSMKNYSTALEFLVKGQKTLENSQHETNPALVDICKTIGAVYTNMCDYLKALEYFQKSHDMLVTVLPLNYPSLADLYRCFSSVYYKMSDYSKALEYCDKTLQMEEMISPRNRSSVGHTYSFMGKIYLEMSNSRKAAEFYKKANDIIGVSLPVTIRDENGSFTTTGITISCIGGDSHASDLHEDLRNTLQNLYNENRKSVNSRN
ncbi:unnamed protein product [Rotaria socialis]|uniref:NAD(P)(+)--arginine ADP-ribosyltransferase n=2 Tax=Rotaria socialis TaxID=392032 RepID=A0A817TPI1_9BILA|nr:unnamed protein product [Rotaria socialis]